MFLWMNVFTLSVRLAWNSKRHKWLLWIRCWFTFVHIPFRFGCRPREASRLEAKTHEAEAKTHEAEATTHEAEAKAEARFFGLEAEARPRGLTSLPYGTCLFMGTWSTIHKSNTLKCLSKTQQYPNCITYFIVSRSQVNFGWWLGICSNHSASGSITVPDWDIMSMKVSQKREPYMNFRMSIHVWPSGVKNQSQTLKGLKSRMLIKIREKVAFSVIRHAYSFFIDINFRLYC